MYRLFVAIRPPEAVRRLLVGVMGGVSGARWQSDDQLHLTLRFIGEVDRHQAGDVVAALGAVHYPPFEIALNGIGTFDRRGRPVTIWAGVAPQAPVQALHRKVDQALARIGLEPDPRAFLPHITMARLKPGSGTVRNLIEDHGGLASPLFRVEAFSLFESRLTPEGAVYSIVESWPLD
jgi:2'-5' RNA ligase